MADRRVQSWVASVKIQRRGDSDPRCRRTETPPNAYSATVPPRAVRAVHRREPPQRRDVVRIGLQGRRKRGGVRCSDGVGGASPDSPSPRGVPSTWCPTDNQWSNRVNAGAREVVLQVTRPEAQSEGWESEWPRTNPVAIWRQPTGHTLKRWTRPDQWRTTHLPPCVTGG
jgi:hypothetical protein